MISRLATFVFAAALAGAAPALAQDDDATYPSLAQVMEGATAMTTVANAFLFVTNADGGWICAIDLNSNYFTALVRGDDVVAEQTVPSSLCVPATNFKTAME